MAGASKAKKDAKEHTTFDFALLKYSLYASDVAIHHHTWRRTLCSVGCSLAALATIASAAAPRPLSRKSKCTSALKLGEGSDLNAFASFSASSLSEPEREELLSLLLSHEQLPPRPNASSSSSLLLLLLLLLLSLPLLLPTTALNERAYLL
jgi:hypothetical protein